MIKRGRYCLAMVITAVLVFLGLATAERSSPRFESVDGVCVVESSPSRPTLLSGWEMVDGNLELCLQLGDSCEELYVLRPNQASVDLLIDGTESTELWNVGDSVFRIEGRGTTHYLTLLLRGRIAINPSNIGVFVGTSAALLEQRNTAVLLRFFTIGLEFATLFFAASLWFRKRSETYLIAFGAYTVFVLLHVIRQALNIAAGSVLPNVTTPNFSLWEVAFRVSSVLFSLPWSAVVEFCLLFLVLREFVPVKVGRVSYLWVGLFIWSTGSLLAIFSRNPAVGQIALASYYPASYVIVYLILFRSVLRYGTREQFMLLFAWSLATPILLFNWVFEFGPIGAYGLGARVGLVGVAGSIQLMGLVLAICTRFADKFTEAEKLSNELENVNSSLEQAVFRKTAELQRSYDSLKEEQRRHDEFISNVAHSIKTPLFSVSGYCEMASSCIDSNPAQAAEFIDIARCNVEQAQMAVKEFLLAIRLENRCLQFLPVKVDVCEMTRRVVASILPRARLAGVSIKTNFFPGDQVFCLADGAYLSLAIENIVVNAVESCQEQGCVHIEIVEKGLTVFVRIIDNGCGMDEQTLGHIFERYWSDKHGRCNGTGLGLSIAKDIVEQNDGFIKVKSELGKGSTFTLVLPMYSE